MRIVLNSLKTGLLLLVLAVTAQQVAVEITSEPSHHKVFENRWLRVFNVTVAPKATTLVHRHNYDYLFVTLGDSDVTNAKVGAQPVQLKLKDGEVRFTLGGFAHAAINNSDNPFHNITIELLEPSSGEHNCTESCAVSTNCKSADPTQCPAVEKLLVSDQWTVTSVTLPSQATYEQHSHNGNHFSVAVSDLDLRVNNPDRQAAEVHQKTGDVAWHGPVMHSITNIGSKPARFVSLEFKGNGSRIRPGI